MMGSPPVVTKDCEYRERVCVSTVNVDWKYNTVHTFVLQKNQTFMTQMSFWVGRLLD